VDKPEEPSFLMRLVGDVQLAVFSARALTDEEFERLVAEGALATSARVVLAVNSPDLKERHASTFNAKRRGRVAQAGLLRKPIAVLVGSTMLNSFITRCVQTALRWLGAKMQLFELGEFDRACDHLRIEPALRVRLREEIELLDRELDANVSAHLPNR
jgi:hypothetical protein